MEGRIEVCTATIHCGHAPLSSSRSGSRVGIEGEIGSGDSGGYCGSFPPSPSASMHSISNVVGHHEATDNLLLENEAISLGSIRTKNHRGLIVSYLNVNSI